MIIGVKKISVIIPIYNAKNELNRCLESICNQTYENLEIICIDDGSTDGSAEILRRFSKGDKRIKAVYKTNGGESNARNTGLKMATGEYIAFCDCDDWIDKDMYELLVQVLENESVDLVAASWYKETHSCSQEIKNELPVNTGIFGREEFLKYLYMRDSYRGFAYIWDKLYKREILNDKNGNFIPFDETLRIGGDVLYLAEIALNVNKVRYVEKAFYHYNQRYNSGCHTKDVEKLRDWLRAYEIVIKKFQEENINKEIVDYVKRFLVYQSSNAVEIAIAQEKNKAKKEFQKFMREYEHEYILLNSQYPERIIRYKNLLEQ